jgi:hypothetical protein
MLVGAQKPGLCCAVVTQCGLWRLRGCPRHGGYVAHQCIGRFTVAAFADATAASQTASLLPPLIVDVQVCVRELLDGRKRILDRFIGLKSHCYRFDVLPICTN